MLLIFVRSIFVTYIRKELPVAAFFVESTIIPQAQSQMS